MIINKRDQGFTLTEMVCVLVVSTIMFVVTVAYYVTDIRSRMSVIERAALSQEASIVQRYLLQKLTFAYPDSVSISSGGRVIRADIRGGHIEHPDYQDGPRRVWYQLSAGSLREAASDTASPPTPPSPLWVLISDNVTDFRAEKIGDNYLRLQWEIGGTHRYQTGITMLGDIQDGT